MTDNTAVRPESADKPSQPQTFQSRAAEQWQGVRQIPSADTTGAQQYLPPVEIQDPSQPPQPPGTDNGASAINTTADKKSDRQLLVGIELDKQPDSLDQPTLADKFNHLTPEQKAQVLNAGATAFATELGDQGTEIAQGVADGAMNFGKGMLDLAWGAGKAVYDVSTIPDKMLDFGVNLVLDPEKAQNDAAATGKQIGETLIAGKHIADVVVNSYWGIEQYRQKVGAGQADPVADAAHGIQLATDGWDKMSTHDKAAAGTEVLLSFVPIERAAAATEAIVTIARTPSTRLQEMRALCTTIDEGLAKTDADLARYEKSAAADRLGENEVHCSNAMDGGKALKDVQSWKELPARSDDMDLNVKVAAAGTLERMTPAEQAVAKRLTPTGFNSVAAKDAANYDATYEHTLGTFKRLSGPNDIPEVSISEYVKQGGEWIKNNDLPATVCHEFGHAMNVMLESWNGAISDSQAFMKEFAPEWSKAIETRSDDMNKLFNNETYYKKERYSEIVEQDGIKKMVEKERVWLNADNKPEIDVAKVRDEVFAELYAQAKGYKPSSNFAELLRDLFDDTTSKFMESKYGWSKPWRAANRNGNAIGKW